MKNLLEDEIELPPFPVYKSYILPYRPSQGEDKLVNVLEVREENVRNWIQMVKNLKEFLNKSLEIIGREESIDRVKKIELINDMIVLYFKLPLIRELLPSIMPSPYKAYLFYRLIGRRYEELEKPVQDILEFTNNFYDELVRRGFLNTEVCRFLDQEEVSNIIEKCWFEIPADTRPGLNTSGLIPHLILTAAIAWALAVEKRLSREETAIVVLAALLHDMGKPLRYHRHVEASITVCKYVIKDFLPEVEERITQLVQRHHLSTAEDPLVNLLRDADRKSSAIDRVQKLVYELLKEELLTLSEKLGIDFKEIYAGAYSWSLWERIHNLDPDAIRRLSEGFVTRLRSRLDNFTKILETGKDEYVEGDTDILIGLIDIGSIQEFITTTSELKSLAAASLVIDNLTMSYIPYKLQNGVSEEFFIPLASILYAGGGVIEFVIPPLLRNNIEEAIEKLNERTLVHDLPLRWSITSLLLDYSKTILKLAENMHITKYKIKEVQKNIELKTKTGVKQLCQICYRRSPVERIPTPEGDKEVCNTCKKLYRIGLEIHFKQRYISGLSFNNQYVRFEDVLGYNWDEAEKYIIELISGHDREELYKVLHGEAEYRDIAVVKLDGNLMGPYMASCITLTDAYERSARIDIALKKSIEKVYKIMFEAVNVAAKENGKSEAEKAVLQLKLGIIYVGGDDALLLMPSWIAPGFALVVGREFSINMGGVRGLSIGLSVGKAKADLWGLIDAASTLMSKAKKLSRSNPNISYICFDVSETSTLTGTSVNTRFNELEASGLSIQPLKIEGEDSFSSLIQLILYETDPVELFKKLYLMSRFDNIEKTTSIRNEVKTIKEKMKSIRTAINDSIDAARSMINRAIGLEDYLVPLSYTYAIKQAVKTSISEKTREGYKIVSLLARPKNIDSEEGRKWISLYSDADRLIKICGGGVI